MSNLYKTRVNAYGGRSGTIRSEDGILDMPLALPKELGGKGGATNPEQLFAAGYAACFENAVIHVTRTQADKVRDEDIEVSCEVGLAPNGEDGFKLVVALDVEIAAGDVVQGLVINHIRHICVLQQRVHTEHGVVRFHGSRGNLRA